MANRINILNVLMLILRICVLGSVHFVAAAEVSHNDYISNPKNMSQNSRWINIPSADTMDSKIENVRYNWSTGYRLQSILYMAKFQGDNKWVELFIESANHLLSQRDALVPNTQIPYAWYDKSEELGQPYVWAGYTGHNFAPLMEFAHYVSENPQIGKIVYNGVPVRDYAIKYIDYFETAYGVHASDIRNYNDYSYLVFSGLSNTSKARLDGKILPVNMNAAFFDALMHALAADKKFGRDRFSNSYKRVVGFVNYLNYSVLRITPCMANKKCLLWNYSEYMNRTEDIGHSNNVAKFLLDAHLEGYEVPETKIRMLSNTFDGILDANGDVNSFMLDGTGAPKPTSVYYIVLYSAFSDSLYQKSRFLVDATSNFSYAGPWAAVNSPKFLSIIKR